ncbi:MAG: hypothetical protein AABX29_02505 [Nanoarchaeota archaeon]
MGKTGPGKGGGIIKCPNCGWPIYRKTLVCPKCRANVREAMLKSEIRGRLAKSPFRPLSWLKGTEEKIRQEQKIARKSAKLKQIQEEQISRWREERALASARVREPPMPAIFSKNEIAEQERRERRIPLPIARPATIPPRGTPPSSPATPSAGATPSPGRGRSLRWIIILLIIILSMAFLGSLSTSVMSGLGFGNYWWIFFIGLLILAFAFLFRKNKWLSAKIPSPGGSWLGWVVLIIFIILIVAVLGWTGWGRKLYSIPFLSFSYAGIAGLLFIVGLFLALNKKKDKRFIGYSLIVFSIIVVFFAFAPGNIFSSIYALSGWGFWLFIIFSFLALVALITKKFTWFLLFFFLAIVVWFLGSASSSPFLESLGTKAQVAGGESFFAKIGKYIDYIKDPQAFFARYGEFGNPNIENKALVGLKIDKFEPLIKEFRSSQDLRFTAEVKHYGLPKFSDEKADTLNIGVSCYVPKEMQEIQANLETYYADEVMIKPGSSRPYQPPILNDFSPENEMAKKELDKDFRYKSHEQLIEESKFKNFTKFVTCTFKAGNVPAMKDKETRRAYINVSYRNFITRSDIYVYLLGNNAYQKIEDGVLQAGGDLDTEFLYQLRNAASYPGLIDNERRTISEFSSGPAWLQVNILDQQPLKSGGTDQYTLRVKSMPNSVDWTNALYIKDIYLEVPSRFNAVDSRCDFIDATSTQVGSAKSNVKRLRLKDNFGSDITKEKLLGDCSGQGAGCGFTCDFAVGSGNEQNIQEYRISAYQLTDYTITQGTTFDYVKSRTTGVIDENENAKNNASGYMGALVASNKKEELERYISICRDSKDTLTFNLLSTETINILKNYCNENKIQEVNNKLNQLNKPTGAEMGSTPTATQPVVTGSEEFKAGQPLTSKDQLDRLPIGSIVDDSTYTSYKKSNDGWYVTNIKEILIRKVSIDDILANKPINIYRVGTNGEVA